MYDFIYKKKMISLQKCCMMGMGEKHRNRKQKTNKNKEKISRLVALPYPLIRYGGRRFSGVLEHRKQAGRTLSGRGFLI